MTAIVERRTGRRDPGARRRPAGDLRRLRTLRGRRSAHAASRRSMRAWVMPAGVPIGLPGELPSRFCSSSGARRSTASRAMRSTRSNTAASNGSPSRSGRAVARRWAAVGVGADLVTHVPVHAGPRPDARLRPGRAHRPPRGPRAGTALRAAPASLAGDDRPVRPRPAGPGAQRARRVRGATSSARDRRPRSLGPAHRRRRDDRRRRSPPAPRRSRAPGARRVGHHRRPRALTSAGPTPRLYSDDDPIARR